MVQDVGVADETQPPASPGGTVVLRGPDAIDREALGPQRLQQGRFACLALALALHGGIALALLAGPEEPFGAWGRDLEAISVEVAIVSASALESRVQTPDPAAASHGAIDQAEGGPVASAASPEVKPADADLTTGSISEQAADQPPPPPPHVATLTPDELPRDRDTATLPERVPEPPRPVDRPSDSVPSAKLATEPTPEPESTADPDKRQEQPKRPPVSEASPGSVATDAGGAPSRSTTGATRPSSAAAAASAGAMRAFAQSVVKALARSRPTGQHGRARGTVKISFVVAEGGGLERVEIAATSGHTALDAIALAAVRRASLPAPPPGMTAAQRTYVMPYKFN
ncbi:MAG: TonB family protein [Hyphomicrobiaceae bacterium]|nr:TonB family protein [Hyphomicrobiaceae bacterium]